MIKVSKIEYYLPEKILTNDEMEKSFRNGILIEFIKDRYHKRCCFLILAFQNFYMDWLLLGINNR